ncbi:MAG: hypothetical protein LBI36_01855 [Oscillospiraceae bacterium]|jgi:hypothetical protein|nr:hypothetical protein [Oscillospiraceae bacterium]
MDGKIIKYNGKKYVYLGNAHEIFGAGKDRKISKTLYFRCVKCGYVMNGNLDKTDICTCGKLKKEAEGRLSSSLGDDSIEVYKKG